jgi:hypothetical protein
MKTLRPLWAFVFRNTFPSRVTGSFRTGDKVLMISTPSLRGNGRPGRVFGELREIDDCGILLLYHPRQQLA